MEIVNQQRCFAGTQGVFQHESTQTGTTMRFALYMPDEVKQKGKLPLLWFLSGLTCSEENFTVKAGAQRYACEHGVALIAPDTSPRGAGIEGEEDDYDFGSGAGFYVDAVKAPWAKNYNMYSYINEELYQLVANEFEIDDQRQGIMGHSMGGHGALMIGLRNTDKFKSISAFSPICAPMQSPWGQKAFAGYLGDDQSLWEAYDAVQLIRQGRKSEHEILVDIGDADNFLSEQLKPELLEQACAQYGQKLNLTLQPGFDHSYFFIASFIGKHIAFHAEKLSKG